MKPILEVSPPGAPPYPVLIGADVTATLCARWSARHHHAVVIADHTTERLFATRIADALRAHGLEVLCCSFAPGEAQKTRSTKAALEDRMLAAGVDRRGCVVAVGGGVVLDVAGFVAATYLRGIAHINVATTLLAQVDAAIGGKTAVNTEHGKNLIGCIHHPRAVLLAAAALDTLPDVELGCGLAEMVKHAVLSDATLFDTLEAWQREPGRRLPPSEVIERCVAIKAEVIADDDRDEGRRNILNYGHTVAHAIEHATLQQTPHGHAVAMGMVIESRLAAASATFPRSDLSRIVRLLEGLGLPTSPTCTFAAAEPFFARDKKSVAGEVRCSIPERIGQTGPQEGSFTRTVSLAELEAAWSP